MAQRVAWILNLDAEEELAAGDSYRASASLERILECHRPAAARALLVPDAVLVERGVRLPAGDWLGRAWCPTPRARAQRRAVGAVPEPAPDAAVLRAANERGLVRSLGQTLEEAAFLCDPVAVREHLNVLPGVDRWLLKRNLGVAGRGQRAVSASAWKAADARWLASALGSGGVQVEPLLDLEVEYVLHGWVPRRGAARLGQPLVQETSRGAWRRTRSAVSGELTPSDADQLQGAGERVAEALAALGYFGPFGMDAYRYRDRSGGQRLNPLSEINARYTMGWALGAAGWGLDVASTP